MLNSENQVGTVQHLFALQIVFLSNRVDGMRSAERTWETIDSHDVGVDLLFLAIV